MSSKFQRNRAPGWTSSDEEYESEEGEATSSDDEISPNSSKRPRTNDQKPTGPISNTGAGAKPNEMKPVAKKINTIWSDVLVDQQLSGGVSQGVTVMAGDTFVPRGSETYDCTKTKELEKPSVEKDEQMAEEPVDKGNESNDDPFADEHVEAPDFMATLVEKREPRGNFNGANRKRPWQRGGTKRWDRDGSGDSRDQSTKDAQSGDRGHGRGQWRDGRGRGRGRGRGQCSGDRSHSGGRRKIEKISLNAEDPPKEIALAIARSLNEVKTDLMTRAVQCVGVEKAIQLYSKTVDIENSGGMMTLDGRRRRTPGGVFFYLLREDPEIPEGQKTELFGQEREEYRKQLSAKRRLQKKEGDEMEGVSDEKPLKDSKEAFLEEALKNPKPEAGGCGGVKSEEASME